MIQERILLLMKAQGMTPTQFADEIGIQRSSISHILSGRNNPSLDVILKILGRFKEIDSNWLILGKGNLLKERDLDNSPTLFNLDEDEEIIDKNLKEIDLEEEEKEIKTNNIEIQENIIAIQNPNSQRSISKIIILYNDNSYEELVKN
ncbi:MAG: helix-turn-helix domain-containing protein [Bacteroidales bacterium]